MGFHRNKKRRRWRRKTSWKKLDVCNGNSFHYHGNHNRIKKAYFVSTYYSLGFYIDNYTNGQINNEKFVIAMILAGSVLLYWGYFKKKEDDEQPYEHGWRKY